MWRSVAGWRHPAFDAAIAVVLLITGLLDLFTGVLGGVFPGASWVHVPFIVAMAAPIAWRRRWPLSTLLVVAIVQSMWIFGLYPLDQQPPLEPFVALLIAVYSASAYAEGRAARAAWVTVAIGVLSDIPSLIQGKPIGNVAGPDVTLLIAFSLGLGFARSRRRAETHERRAAQAELDAVEAVQRARVVERARIARELHDVVSHDVSLMVVQASVERRAMQQGTHETVAQTLESIESTGREALAELRRMLGVLRKTGDSTPLEPQRGLAQLPDLVARTGDAGVPVHLRIDGDPTILPSGVDLTAYRVLQESLTNIVKHAPASSAQVTLRYTHDAVEIDILNATNSYPVVQLPSGGHGLVGMRERVALYGGAFEAERRPNGDFHVHARIPVTRP